MLVQIVTLPNYFKVETRELQEYYYSGQYEKDMASRQPGEIPPRAGEIMLPIFMNEFSINPILEDWVLDGLTGKLSDFEVRELDKLECP